jgi:hypothetical protein
MQLKQLGAVVLGLAAMNAMACYTVYDKSNRIAYQGFDAPVDMSQPLSTALQARFPGGHMVFEQNSDCPAISLGQLSRPAGIPAPANTAVMGAGPAQKVAMVQPSPMRSTVPASAYAGIPNTAVMGGPGRIPNTAVMGAPSRAMMDPGLSSIAPRNSAGSSPLLTDRATALAMGVPHTQLSGNIVVVPGRAAAQAENVTITRFRPAPQVSARTSDTVITELRDPPVTVVQGGGETTILSQR